MKVRTKEDCSDGVGSMLNVPMDTDEGLKEGIQPLPGVEGTDSGSLNNNLF